MEISINNKTVKLTKHYYSIGEVSKIFGVANSLIRYWESEFPSIKPKKDKNGDRKFTTKDITNIHEVYILVKERGFTLDGALLELKKPVNNNNKQLLSNLRHKLESIKKRLQSFDDFSEI